MKVTLIDKRTETVDAITFIFKPERTVTWQAGQYIEYTLPHPDVDDRGIKRWFTISRAPYEQNLSITTRFAPKSSTFKTALRQLEIGQTVEAGQPEGDFVLTDPMADYVFIAGGIGITPFRSILQQANYDGQKLKVELLYGNRDDATTVFKTELETLAKSNPNLVVRYINEPQRIDAATIKAIADYHAKSFYVSGPEPMVEAFEKLLSDLGIPEEQQHRDYFPGYEWESKN
jgi:ferredoxin-NADP reductase